MEKWNPTQEAINNALRPNTVRKWLNTLLIVIVGGGIIFLIIFSNNRKAENERIAERETHVKDSLRQANDKSEALKRIEKENAEKLRLIESEKITTAKIIDGYTNKANTKFDVNILIIDNNKQIVNDLSSKIANLYRNQGYSVTNSLFTTSFIQSKYFSELQNSSSKVIDMLNLNNHVKFIIIGQYSEKFEKGEYTKFICRGDLIITIISCVSKSQSDGFRINASNGFDDEVNAKKGTIEKILNDYQINHNKL